MPETQLRAAGANIARAAAYALGASVVALIAALVALAVVLALRPDVEQIKTGDTPASVAARQRSAVLMFETCAKDESAIDPVKRDDFALACEGYSTLAEAYKTQNVHPPD